MNVQIFPASLHGKVCAPPSKSIAHRALICAALARGKEHSFSRRSIEGHGGNHRCFKSNGRFYHSERKRSNGHWNRYSTRQTKIDCMESGSTLRFLIPIAAAKGMSCRFCRFRTSAGTAIGTLFRRISKERCIP